MNSVIIFYFLNFHDLLQVIQEMNSSINYIFHGPLKPESILMNALIEHSGTNNFLAKSSFKYI